MVERTTKKSLSKYIKDAYVTLDFKTIWIKPTHYTLRHMDWSNHYMMGWNLLGSLDGMNYEIIKKHGTKGWFGSTPASPFTKPEESVTFKIENVNKYYNHFKIQITKKNSGDDWGITFNGFEIYGYVRGNKI